jgi:sialate O-acetylesterase
VEARRLLEDLKNLPPQPDRLEQFVAESKTYQLVYDVDLGNPKVYLTDNHATIKPFDRIAYFVELQSSDDVTYLYVSLDAFTDDAAKIGIPFLSTNVKFQQNVSNMNVISNVKDIVTGSGITGGNIEFWGTNYGGWNSANVPGASNEKFDFGDQPASSGDYGCMQVHNHDAKQTLFAFNKWNSGSSADLGIGNQPSGNPDWTFSGSAGRYKMKRMRVLVHVK